ncbi:hypothetical protein Tco_0027042 [Tanacetum coccineum]
MTSRRRAFRTHMDIMNSKSCRLSQAKSTKTSEDNMELVEERVSCYIHAVIHQDRISVKRIGGRILRKTPTEDSSVFLVQESIENKLNLLHDLELRSQYSSRLKLRLSVMVPSVRCLLIIRFTTDSKSEGIEHETNPMTEARKPENTRVRMWRMLLKMLKYPEAIRNGKVGTSFDTAYHPQTDDKAREPSNSRRYLRAGDRLLEMVGLNICHWSSFHTITLLSSIKAAPFEALYGRKCRSPVCWAEKCHADEPLAVPLDGLHFDDNLQFVEEPIEITDHEVKRLKRSRISLVKVRWNSKRGPEFAWEREDQFQKKYPHLF